VDMVRSVNVPVYSPLVSDAVLSLFNDVTGLHDEVSNPKEHGGVGFYVPKPDIFLNKTVREKLADKGMATVRAAETLVDELETEDDKKSLRMATEKLRTFINVVSTITSHDMVTKWLQKEVKDVDASQGLSGVALQNQRWERMIVALTNETWRENLHFKNILSLFDFKPEHATTLRDREWPVGDELKRLDGYSLRWIGKAFYPLRTLQCDVANFVCSLMNPDVDFTTGHEEEKTVAQLVDFKKILDMPHEERQSRLLQLPVPTHLVHDAEGDDMLTAALLRFCHRELLAKAEYDAGTSPVLPKIMVQLPTAAMSDVALNYETFRRRHGFSAADTEVLKDGESKNMGQVVFTHKDTCSVLALPSTSFTVGRVLSSGNPAGRSLWEILLYSDQQSDQKKVFLRFKRTEDGESWSCITATSWEANGLDRLKPHQTKDLTLCVTKDGKVVDISATNGSVHTTNDLTELKDMSGGALEALHPRSAPIV